MKTIGKILKLFEIWFARPFAPWLVLAITAVTVAPSLTQGRGLDDFIHGAVFKHSDIALGRAPADLFDFASGKPEDAERLRADGVFPWWADGVVKLHFFRPIASLSHSLDYALWPDNPVGEHAQSIVWYLLLCGAVWLVLRRSAGPRWLAVLAFLLFAIDDTHGATLGWIASRNSILCAFFGFLTLWSHDRWRRDGWRAGALLAPLFFALAMGSGEAGVATVGYLVAYAVFMDSGSRAQRVLRLAPYLLLVAAFGAIYAFGSYGAKHVSMYIDPVLEPGRFVVALVTRLPIYLHALLAGPPSEAWSIYPMLHPAAPYIAWTLAVAIVGTWLWLLRPILKDDREGKFWLAGAALAAAPACAGFPHDRLMLFPSVGVLAVVARFIVAVVRDGATLYPSKGLRRCASFMAFWLFAWSVPLSVLLLEVRETGTRDPQRVFARADASLPEGDAIAGKTLVLVNPPFDPIVFYMQYARAARGATRPAHTRVLATSGGRELVVERVDERTLRVSGAAGLLSRVSDMMMRSSERDLYVGATVDVPGMQVQIERVTADGCPAQAVFRFGRPLEDPSLVWMRWDQTGFTSFTPPSVGKSVALAKVDMVKLFTKK